MVHNGRINIQCKTIEFFPTNVNSVSEKCDPKSVIKIYFKIKIISWTGLFSVFSLSFFIVKRIKFTNDLIQIINKKIAIHS